MSEILNSINHKYSSLQRIHETCALQLQESESRCRVLEAQINGLENKNNWSIGQMDKLQGQLIEANSQFKKMEELFINREKTVEFIKKDLRELSARYDALKIEYDIMTDKFENVDKQYKLCADANFNQNKLLLHYKETLASKNIMIEKYKVYLADIYPHIRASLSFIGLTYFVYVVAGILQRYLL